ncbi:juvenile hormone epoxide hydrolase 2 [Anabrus simplex]|uniref:juvenile hormone epoxide hydrolase 2 n=1 Tax=Anabrus simplex TaxID=316456 RepID=UPI0035A2F132
MGLLHKLLFHGTLFVVLISIGIGILVNKLSQPAPVPELSPQWWGAGQPRKDDPAIKPFQINISKQVIDDLNSRLRSTAPMTAPLEGVGFEYGFNTEHLKSVVDFWLNKYNWKEREAFLNSLPQFKTQVSGLQLHYIHVKPSKVPSGVTVVPLLLLHGWPGSIREFYQLIPLLTTPHHGTDFIFEVIAPSLPGYGFSEGASKPGLGPAQIAVVFKSLMEKLGFKKFYVQGGDWGSAIGSSLATLYPQSVLGYHSNFCFLLSPWNFFKSFVGGFWPSLVVEEQYASRMYPTGKIVSHLLEESGYMHIQASKPDTVGIALRDSPVGLAAYLLEKFSTWTDPALRSLPDGGLTKKYSLTDLLDNVMIYWVTGSITTSMRLYSEFFRFENLALKMDSVPCVVPTACAVFPHELGYSPESFMRDKYPNLVKYTHLPRGGHFAAFEEPELLAEDIWSAVQIMRQSNKS